MLMSESVVSSVSVCFDVMMLVCFDVFGDELAELEEVSSFLLHLPLEGGISVKWGLS